MALWGDLATKLGWCIWCGSHAEELILLHHHKSERNTNILVTKLIWNTKWFETQSDLKHKVIKNTNILATKMIWNIWVANRKGNRPISHPLMMFTIFSNGKNRSKVHNRCYKWIGLGFVSNQSKYLGCKTFLWQMVTKLGIRDVSWWCCNAKWTFGNKVALSNDCTKHTAFANPLILLHFPPSNVLKHCHRRKVTCHLFFDYHDFHH